jgi:flagellar biosynthetic protein FliQ
MNDAMIVDLARSAMMMAASLAAPMLLMALGIGLVVSVLQAVTQIQEQTLAFVPKLIAVSMVFLVGLPWMIETAVKYTTQLLRSIPSLAS